MLICAGGEESKEKGGATSRYRVLAVTSTFHCGSAAGTAGRRMLSHSEAGRRRTRLFLSPAPCQISRRVRLRLTVRCPAESSVHRLRTATDAATSASAATAAAVALPQHSHAPTSIRHPVAAPVEVFYCSIPTTYYFP